jgi:hypothetical protein
MLTACLTYDILNYMGFCQSYNREWYVGYGGGMLALESRVPDETRKLIHDCQTEDNWDDDGAVGITADACNVALQLLEAVIQHDKTLVMPGVSPSVFGSVTFHWKMGNRHLLVRPSPDTDLAYYQYEHGKDDSIYGDEPKRQVIERVLKFLCSQNAE